MEEILREAVEKGAITCPKCSNQIEPDCGECGWINPLIEMGLI